jgi:hypothetical protein
MPTHNAQRTPKKAVPLVAPHLLDDATDRPRTLSFAAAEHAISWLYMQINGVPFEIGYTRDPNPAAPPGHHVRRADDGIGAFLIRHD